jgi:hypothetical protein
MAPAAAARHAAVPAAAVVAASLAVAAFPVPKEALGHHCSLPAVWAQLVLKAEYVELQVVGHWDAGCGRQA